MAIFPADGGSDGTWGAELRAYHAISTDLATGKIKDGAVQVTSAAPTVDEGVANKKYVDDNVVGVLNGSPTTIFRKYFTGTLESDANTNVAHGITGIDNILHVSVLAFDSGPGTYSVSEIFESAVLDSSYRVRFDATNIIITSVGADVQGQKYRIKIDHI